MQRQHQASLVDWAHALTKDFPGKGVGRKLLCRGAVPEKVRLQPASDLLGLCHKAVEISLLKTQKNLIGLEFESPPRWQTDLQACLSLAQDAGRLKGARLFKENIHARSSGRPGAEGIEQSAVDPTKAAIAHDQDHVIGSGLKGHLVNDVIEAI